MSLWSKVYPGAFAVETALTVLVAVSLIAGVALAAAGCLSRRPAAAHGVLLWALVWILITPLAAVGARLTGLSLVSLPGPAGKIVSSLQATFEWADNWPASTITPSDANSDVATCDVPGRTEPFVESSQSSAKTADAAAATGNFAVIEGPPSTNVAVGTGAVGRLRGVLSAIIAAWSLGAIVLLGRTLQSMARTRAIRRSLLPLDAAACGGLLEDVRRRLNAAGIPEIACSDQVGTPCVIGLLRPVIVLPTGALQEVGRGQLCDVLVHECAHVVRRDCVVVLLQRLAAALFWPSPLIHLFNRRLTRVREEVCDNYVLAGGDAVSYGETLLRFAELARGKPPMAASVGILHWRRPLEKRIAALIDERRNTQTRTGLLATTVALTAFGSLSLLACSTGLSSEPTPTPTQGTTQSPTSQEPRQEPRRIDSKEGIDYSPTPPPAEPPKAHKSRVSRGLLDALRRTTQPRLLSALDTTAVVLVKDQPHTLFVPEKVRVALGIRTANQDQLAVAKTPTRMPTLVMTGSTALDPGSIVRVRAISSRSGDKVIEIGKVVDFAGPGKAMGIYDEREIRAGDRVAKGQMLVALYSREVANAERDLIDAASQLRLDEEIVKGMQAKPEVVPEALRLTGLRNVQVDKNGINRATSNLHAWGIPQKEIDGMLEEAEKIPKRGGKHDPAKDAQLGRVEIRSPADGVVIERNVAANEVIPDNTINLFQLANLEKLLVIGNFPEDKVIGGESPTWTVETARGPLPCVITDTGIHVEPNQRTTFIKGIVDNKRGLLQAGQFVNLVLHIPTPRNVVEIPTICVETIEGGPPVVFVQKDPAIANYTMQPVAIVQKVGETTFVRSENANRIGVDKPRAAESVPPTQPLLPGTRLLQSGVEELVGILQDRERKARGESK